MIFYKLKVGVPIYVMGRISHEIQMFRLKYFKLYHEQ